MEYQFLEGSLQHGTLICPASFILLTTSRLSPNKQEGVDSIPAKVYNFVPNITCESVRSNSGGSLLLG